MIKEPYIQDDDMTTYDLHDLEMRGFAETPREKAAREYRNILTVAEKSPAVKNALEQLLMVYELAKDPNDPDIEHESGIEDVNLDDLGYASLDDFARLERLYDDDVPFIGTK